MPSTSTLHAPQLARLQLRLVPVRPSFIEITSHKVVRASYSAAYVLPLTMNEAFSLANGVGKAEGAVAEPLPAGFPVHGGEHDARTRQP